MDGEEPKRDGRRNGVLAVKSVNRMALIIRTEEKYFPEAKRDEKTFSLPKTAA